MTRIILVRHGETLWNVEAKYQGHSDVELSDRGIKQAEAVARRLSAEPLAAVYSSDLNRAYVTARYIAAEHGLEVNIVQALREIKFGDWEGLTHGQVTAGWPGVFEQLFANPDLVKIPGGETFSELKDRALTAVEDLVRRHAGQTIAVVSHGATIRTIICAALGIHLNKIWNIQLDNTAVSIINYHKRPVLALLNDVHHLADLK